MRRLLQDGIGSWQHGSWYGVSPDRRGLQQQDDATDDEQK